MFNLLPEERKKKIKKEYHLRFYTLLLTMFSVTGVITLVFLTPSFFAVGAKENRAQDRLEILEQQIPELKEKENLESTVRRITRKIEILEPQDTALPSQLIEMIIGSQPNGISITAISYSISEKIITLVLTGSGSTRESLTTFTRNLRENETFDDVEFPVSNLAKDQNINFSITLTVDLEND